jgi:F-type H+-transporting ATPase subunit a
VTAVGEEALEHIVFMVGPLRVSRAVVMTWLLMALLTGAAMLLTRRMKRDPSLIQTVAEGAVLAIEDAVSGVLPEHTRLVLPFIGTLWIFLVAANLEGLVPGLDSPTADLSVTSALALLVFLSVHWFGVRASGWKAYLRHYVRPNPALLPFHVVGELTRTMALAIRLFGNMMSMETAALMLFSVAALAVPIPVLMLHIVEALVQAYIFGILALVYIAGGIAARKPRPPLRSAS